jgi:hypothetical protein
MLDLFPFKNGLQTIEASVIVVFVYLVAQGIWRIYFSPISKFPGPKLAALTYWYVTP